MTTIIKYETIVNDKMQVILLCNTRTALWLLLLPVMHHFNHLLMIIIINMETFAIWIKFISPPYITRRNSHSTAAYRTTTSNVYLITPLIARFTRDKVSCNKYEHKWSAVSLSHTHLASNTITQLCLWVSYWVELTSHSTHNRPLKPGFHYPSQRPELTGDRFPLPVNTGRVDGPSTRPVNSACGNERQSTRPGIGIVGFNVPIDTL